jgi:hypothetical protein
MEQFRLVGRPAVWGLFFALVFSFSAAGAAEKKQKETEEEKEAKRAAEEDAQEAATSGLAFKPVTLKGRLSLIEIQDGDTANTVAGTFATNQGTFQLKCETLAFRKSLQQNNNKEVFLLGKIRNDGKYFVAHAIEGKGVTPVSPQLTKPGGL